MSTTDLTLDPESWTDFRALAHRMVDDMLDHLASLRSRPAWQRVPAGVRARLEEAVPYEGQGAEAAYRQFVEDVLPYPNGNLHPRFFGWVQGNGTPLGMMADMLASGMNPHLAGFDQAPAVVEETVIRWFIELMGLPPSASGVLTLGGSMANVLGLAVARQARAGFDVRALGLQGRPERLAVYASSETHGWTTKAVELMGLGRRSLRSVPVDHQFRIDMRSLRSMLDADERLGMRPICVVGNAGTVNTGATDDLRELGDLCARRGVWFHVDGAYGALARLSERLRGAVDGIETADSIAFDLHKWMYQPFDVGCVLVRDAEAHKAAFAGSATYLATMDRGVMAGGLTFADRGIDLTRSFRALKVWMSLKAHGVTAFARLIEQNVDQARYLEARIRESPELELLAPVPLNVVYFRFAPSDERANGDLDRINREVLLRLQESGLAVPSSTVLGDRFAIRCAIVNHRTRREDLDGLLAAVVGLGRKVANEIG